MSTSFSAPLKVFILSSGKSDQKTQTKWKWMESGKPHSHSPHSRKHQIWTVLRQMWHVSQDENGSEWKKIIQCLLTVPQCIFIFSNRSLVFHRNSCLLLHLRRGLRGHKSQRINDKIQFLVLKIKGHALIRTVSRLGVDFRCLMFCL